MRERGGRVARRLGAALPCLLAGLAVAGPAPSAQELPPGEGRPLVLETCVQCHDLRPIVSQRKPGPAWRRTVNEMVWRGAPLFPGEAEAVAGYLAAAFGPQARSAPNAAPNGAPSAAAAPAAELPEGPGRELVMAACLSCHDLAPTLQARKSEAEWRHSLGLMARLGAKLNGREQETVARYLARALARP